MKQNLNQEETMRTDTTSDEIGSTENFKNRNLKETYAMTQKWNNWEQNKENEIKVQNINEEKENEMLDINDGEYDDRRMYDDKEIDGNSLAGEESELPSRGRIRVETKL